MKKKEEDIDAEGIARCIVWTNRVGAVVKELKEHGISATDNTELVDGEHDDGDEKTQTDESTSTASDTVYATTADDTETCGNGDQDLLS